MGRPLVLLGGPGEIQSTGIRISIVGTINLLRYSNCLYQFALAQMDLNLESGTNDMWFEMARKMIKLTHMDPVLGRQL